MKTNMKHPGKTDISTRPENRKISACLTVGNEEHNMRRCMESILWADEIVVIDSFSKDKTVEICREYTDRVYQHEWLGYVGQKELIKGFARYPWILFIDADEVVSDQLRNEILHEFNTGLCDKIDGYEFPRMVYYIGKWIRHGEWWPDIKLRLYRKNKGVCAGSEPHDRVMLDGPIKQLHGCLYHYTYDNVGDQISTLNRFSQISSETMEAAGKAFSWTDLLFRPPFRFFKGYILKKGFLDGAHGFIIAVLSAFGVFIKYVKLWEKRVTSKQKPYTH